MVKANDDDCVRLEHQPPMSCGQPVSMRGTPFVPSISPDTSITAPLPQRRVPPAPLRARQQLEKAPVIAALPWVHWRMTRSKNRQSMLNAWSVQHNYPASILRGRIPVWGQAVWSRHTP